MDIVTADCVVRMLLVIELDEELITPVFSVNASRPIALQRALSYIFKLVRLILFPFLRNGHLQRRVELLRTLLIVDISLDGHPSS